MVAWILYRIINIIASAKNYLFCSLQNITILFNIMTMKSYDVIIIGAGAAGLSAAGELCARGQQVLVLDMGNAPARKVAASGGGKCNITNMATGVTRYFGENPNFVRGALSRISPSNILEWCAKHNLKLYEKEPGRYFCTNGADAVVSALMHDAAGADIKYNHTVTSVIKDADKFTVLTNGAKFYAGALIVATGGTSFGALGVSDTGQKIAKSFGHKIVPIRPALCAMAVPIFGADLAGISIDVEILIGREKICDAMLFTHFGLGGPAIYRASVRDFSDGITINICPKVDIFNALKQAKKNNGKRNISNVLSEYMPLRVARYFAQNDTRNIADYKDTEIQEIAQRINKLYIAAKDIKLHNLQSAEVVRGGISTHEISSKTMESKLCSGLFFAGEVIDIAGDLGGFNLQWAWASGRVAGQNA